MQKLILSRKGYDSAAGGGPSPILNDGRMFSLPIPEPKPCESSATYSDLTLGDLTNAEVLSQLGYTVPPSAPAHLDPDLIREARPRDNAWRACLGQVDQSEVHLQRKGVNAGALFLFWGWFEHVDATYRFHSRQGFHAIFGYLEVDYVVDAGAGEIAPFASYHPHFSETYRGFANRVYVARRTLSWNSNRPGWGVFRYDTRLRLSRLGETRSHWQLPGCFHPEAGCELSYLPAGTRWGKLGKQVHVQSPGRGQEFVCTPSQDVIAWASSLIDDNEIWTPSFDKRTG